MIKLKKLNRLFVLTLLFVFAFALQVNAAEGIDTTKDISVEIISQCDEQLLTEMNFEIYKVADIDRYRNPYLTDDFSAFAGEFEGKEHYQMLGYAQQMYTHAIKEEVQPLETVTTDAEGKAFFPQASDQKPGLYLIAGRTHIQGEYVYETQPFLLFVPVYTTEGLWEYHTSVTPKCSRQSLADLYTDITVVKVWQDDGHEAKRPQQITVTLYKDKAVYETVTLSAANNWRHSWTMLEKTALWTVAETPIDGYKTTVKRENDTYIVTNTYERPPRPPEELPDTGQKWQPPLILFTAGMLLIVLGVVRRRTGEYEE